MQQNFKDPEQEQKKDVKIAQNDQVFLLCGVYFCARCRNMMTPNRPNGFKLQFKCQTCGIKTVDFTNKRGFDCIIFNKDIKTLRKTFTPDHAYIFDPTMPTVETKCPQCGYNRAIYFLVANEQETKMIARMMCKNTVGTTIKCGNVWDLVDTSQLEEMKVKVKVMEEEAQQDDDLDIA